jgi:hypothetical protein
MPTVQIVRAGVPTTPGGVADGDAGDQNRRDDRGRDRHAPIRRQVADQR